MTDPLTAIREDEKAGVSSVTNKDGSRTISVATPGGGVDRVEVYLQNGCAFVVSDEYEGAACFSPEAIPLLIEALQALVPAKPKTMPLGEIGPEAF